MVLKFWNFLIANSLLLLMGGAFALLWANAAPHSYHSFTHVVHFLVNDIAMAFFFLLAAKEIREAMLPGGCLSSGRAAALPLMATLGGMTGPAIVYLAGVHFFGESALFKGWAVPTATDIAFSYMVAKFIFGPKHPAISFLLLLAVADDAGGLGILAVFYPQAELRLPMLLIAVLGIAIALILREGITFPRYSREGGPLCFFKTRSWIPYVILPGTLCWIGFYNAGLHPALALVPLAWCMPHAHSDKGVFAPGESRQPDTLNRMEHALKVPVEIVLFFFALVNAGVEIKGGFGLAGIFVLAGLLIGKPVGIFTCAMLGLAFGLKLPEGMNKRDLFIVGVAAGIGFTVALFVATAAYPAGATLDSLKMGALCSLGVAVLAISSAFILRVGRFARR